MREPHRRQHQGVAHHQPEGGAGEAMAQRRRPVGVDLPGEHPGAGREERGGEHPAAGADFEHPGALGAEELEERPAEGGVHQVVLAERLLEERRRHGDAA